jgi:hypothetical protein
VTVSRPVECDSTAKRRDGKERDRRAKFRQRAFQLQRAGPSILGNDEKHRERCQQGRRYGQAAIRKAPSSKLQAPSVPQAKGLVDSRGNPLSSGSATAVVAGLGQVGTAFSEAVQGAVALDKQVAEVGTIAGKDFGGSAGISAKIKEVSATYNQSLGASGEGLYQALSNGFTTAADSSKLLAESAKLAAAGVTTVDASVNLLTAALNSYGKGADEAGNISGKVFETVRLGRLRVDDLANTLGRVSPMAAELGISFNELGASIATVTLSGSKPSEALTQIRGAMNALVKPTEGMQEALRNLGFSSPEEAIAVKGSRKRIVGCRRGDHGWQLHRRQDQPVINVQSRRAGERKQAGAFPIQREPKADR